MSGSRYGGAGYGGTGYGGTGYGGTGYGGGGGLGDLWSRARMSFLAHRRLVVAALVAVAVVLTLTSVRPKPGLTVAVWVAARDLGGGAPLRPGDVRVAHLPSTLVPGGALRADRPIQGRLLAAPVRRGEPLTDVRLLSPALLAAGRLAGDLAVPVRVSDGSAALALLQAGDEVDVIAATDTTDRATGVAAPVVEDVRVLAVADHPSDDGAGLVIVEASPAQATELAQVPIADLVSVALRRSP